MHAPDDELDETKAATPSSRGNEDMTTKTEESTGGPTRLQAREMLGPKGVVQIEHEGEVYTLRLTRNNRLILTK